MRLDRIALVAIALSVAACATVLGINDPILDVDASTDDASIGDAGDATMSTDARDGAMSDADAATNDVATDAPPDAFEAASDAGDGGCPTGAPDDNLGVFVEQGSGSDTTTCGTRMAPCKTIQKGLDRAQVVTGKSIVYVARGAFTEALALHAGLELQGGWEVTGTTWTPTCTNANAAVVITAPDSSNITIFADALGGSATLTTLSVRSRDSSKVLPGDSIYGIFARDATTMLALKDVDVEVVSGGAGLDGAGGDAGASGAGDCLPFEDGGAGAPAGSQGAGSDGGGFGATGFVAGNGMPGGSGALGQNGTAPQVPACVQCVTCSGTITCTVGNGGTSCGTAGGAGCGGLAGGGGAGGRGGGASIALFAFDAIVDVTDGSLRAGSGGNGGVGGPPGDGGAGAMGTSGSPGNSCPIMCGIQGINCVPTAQGQGEAGAGTLGGNGSGGGFGGGGAGGWACGVMQAGAARITIAPTTTLAHGNFGIGGGPSGGTGAPGVAKDRCP